MPTFLRWQSLRFAIYPNDHSPAHVHVIGPKGEAVFVLNCPSGLPNLRESYRLTTKALNEAERVIVERLAELCRRRVRIHGGF